MKEYIVLSSDTVVDLMRDVNRLLQVGWSPCGGIAACGDDSHHMMGENFFQAMTLEINVDADEET